VGEGEWLPNGLGNVSFLSHSLHFIAVLTDKLLSPQHSIADHEPHDQGGLETVRREAALRQLLA
jgi:hypothetical protein